MAPNDPAEEPRPSLGDPILDADRQAREERAAYLNAVLPPSDTSSRARTFQKIGDVLKVGWTTPEGEPREETFSTVDDSGFPVADSYLAYRRRLAEIEAEVFGRSPGPPHRCGGCRDTGWLRFDVDKADPAFGRPTPCLCTEGAQAEARRRENLVDAAGLTAPMRSKTLDAWQRVPGDDEAWAAVYDWSLVISREPPRPPWVHLSGEPGSGKTHLSLAAANLLLDRLVPVRWYYVAELIEECKRRIEDSTVYVLLESLRSAPVLILDDLGTARPTDYVIREILEPLIDHRYRHALPLMVTSIGDPQAVREHLSESIGRRLQDTAICRHVHNAAPQWGGG